MFFFSSRRRHTRLQGDWSSDVCSSDLARPRSRSSGGSGERSGGRSRPRPIPRRSDRKSTRLNSSHLVISYAVLCLKKISKIIGNLLMKLTTNCVIFYRLGQLVQTTHCI